VLVIGTLGVWMVWCSRRWIVHKYFLEIPCRRSNRSVIGANDIDVCTGKNDNQPSLWYYYKLYCSEWKIWVYITVFCHGTCSLYVPPAKPIKRWHYYLLSPYCDLCDPPRRHTSKIK
jgi:hypothetical protein